MFSLSKPSFCSMQICAGTRGEAASGGKREGRRGEKKGERPSAGAGAEVGASSATRATPGAAAATHHEAILVLGKVLPARAAVLNLQLLKGVLVAGHLLVERLLDFQAAVDLQLSLFNLRWRGRAVEKQHARSVRGRAARASRPRPPPRPRSRSRTYIAAGPSWTAPRAAPKRPWRRRAPPRASCCRPRVVGNTVARKGKNR